MALAPLDGNAVFATPARRTSTTELFGVTLRFTF